MGEKGDEFVHFALAEGGSYLRDAEADLFEIGERNGV